MAKKGEKISEKTRERMKNSYNSGRWRDYPELRYDVNNGITLCRFHHPLKWAEESRLAPYFISLIIQNK